MQEPCPCRVDEVFPDGNKTEWYTFPRLMFQRWLELETESQRTGKARYAALHLKKQHLLTFHVPGLCPCTTCLTG